MSRTRGEKLSTFASLVSFFFLFLFTLFSFSLFTEFSGDIASRSFYVTLRRVSPAIRSPPSTRLCNICYAFSLLGKFLSRTHVRLTRPYFRVSRLKTTVRYSFRQYSSKRNSGMAKFRRCVRRCYCILHREKLQF